MDVLLRVFDDAVDVVVRIVDEFSQPFGVGVRDGFVSGTKGGFHVGEDESYGARLVRIGNGHALMLTDGATEACEQRSPASCERHSLVLLCFLAGRPELSECDRSADRATCRHRSAGQRRMARPLNLTLAAHVCSPWPPTPFGRTGAIRRHNVGAVRSRRAARRERHQDRVNRSRPDSASRSWIDSFQNGSQLHAVIAVCFGLGFPAVTRCRMMGQ
jgi:hypothetical protein